MNIGDRISILIDKTCATKTDFATKLGVSQPYISKMVNQGAIPSDRLIEDICEKFHVNEEWLRYGTGDMFPPAARDAEIAAFVGKALSDQSDTFKKRFIRMLSRLTEDEWTLLERKALEIVGDHGSETPEDNNEKSE